MGVLVEADKRSPGWSWRDAATWVGLVLLAACWVLLVRYEGPWWPQESGVMAGPVDDGVVRVVLDPGHGGVDGGATGNGVLEKDLCLALALDLRRELERRGLVVVMTREDDRYLSLRERVALANSYWRAFFVSLHFNHGESESAEGVEVFYADPKSPPAQAEVVARLRAAKGMQVAEDGRGTDFAVAVQRRMIERTGAVDRGVKNRPDFAVVRHVVVPAILVEGGFVSNRREAGKLGDSVYRSKLVRGIGDGIEEFIAGCSGDPYAGVRLDWRTGVSAPW